jgi:uncharacterized protein
MPDARQELKCSSLVIKIASRCNLNCTYCYMYNMGDGTYKNQPKVMPDHVVDALLEKTYQHCLQHGIDQFIFGFHGGEPLLAGQGFFTRFVQEANRIFIPGGIQPVFGLQTNGVLLDAEWCRLLASLNIQVGVSLDGLPEENDKFRIDHAGKGSYNRIVAGLKEAQASSGLQKNIGVLSVINTHADALQTYLHFKNIGVRAIDFLLPDATSDPPPDGNKDGQNNTPVADWLIRIFDYWLAETQGNKTTIRIFENIMMAIFGAPAASELMGTANNELLVIETDGSIEAVDVLRICGDGFTKKNLNILQNDLDDALESNLAVLYHKSHQMLCRKCQLCPINEICGGGYLPHRYKSGNGFDNPSVYCADLLKLITHIQNEILRQLPESLLEEAGIQMLSYEEAAEMIANKTGEDTVDIFGLKNF